MEIHVTSNEAGRNAVFYDRTSEFFKQMIKKIENKEMSSKEVVMCLKAFVKYMNRTLKFKPTYKKLPSRATKQC